MTDDIWTTKITLKNTKKTKKKTGKKTGKKKEDTKDKIVDIPFSKYKSKGTRATRGDIKFQYQEYINIYNFFNNSNFKVNYSNDIIKLVSTSSQRRGHGWGVTRCWEEGTANSIRIKKLPSLSFDKKFNIVMINIQVKDGNHANVALVNNINKTIEYFEPHGHRKNKNSKIGDFKGIYLKKLAFLKGIFKNILPEYTFVNVVDHKRTTSFQTKIDPDDNTGFCVTWCILYAHYRCLNPNLLLIRLLNHLEETITTTKLLRYAKYIEETVKK